MSIETMTKLATYTAGSGADSSITFSNIPQTYTDLVIKICARTTRAGTDIDDEIRLEFNGSGGTAYSGRMIEGNGTTVRSATDSSYAFVTRITVPTDNTTASVFSNSEVYISNYTSPNYKTISIDAVMENNTTSSLLSLSSNLWSNTSAITSIKCTPIGTFDQYSSITIYGVKNLQTALPKVGWASGGIVTSDGTYIYHTFTQTNIFNVNVALKDVETLVIGGAGGGGSFGGGGGAGGLRYQYLSNLNTGLYAAIVGAGGSGGVSNGQGATGTYSMFDIFKASGGGGAGGYTTDGLSGGSGGGGGTQGGVNRSGGSGNAGGYYPVEGYAGGNGYGGGSPYGAGGGGGATAVGATSSGASGAGGAGSSAYSSWGSATSTGQNISGTRWYAGGGGGASNSSYGAGGNGGGASGADTGINGTANTGGGGGGANSTKPGGSGGSGLVIVRYKA